MWDFEKDVYSSCARGGHHGCEWLNVFILVPDSDGLVPLLPVRELIPRGHSMMACLSAGGDRLQSALRAGDFAETSPVKERMTRRIL